MGTESVMDHDWVKGEQVGVEESGTKHRALRATMVNWPKCGGGATEETN